MQLRHRFIMASAVFVAVFAAALFSSPANAVNTFNNRAAWQSAAGTPETIDFSTDGAGNPITNPPATLPFSSLTIKGVTFMNGVSAYNQYIYAPFGGVLRVNLPPNTTAFGLDWSMYEIPGVTTFRLSTGDVFHPPPEGVPFSLPHAFFGVTSDHPIEWVEFSLSSTDLFIDNFSFVAHPMQVGIDVKPDSATNPVNPRSEGVIPVALLAGPGFSTCSIDWQSLRFGVSGNEAQLAGYSNADVNGDGLPDLMLHFRTAETGIACGTSSLALTGQTVTGQKFRGVDSIRTVGCTAK